MCRLLLLSDPKKVNPNPHLQAFRQICKDSPEYQGHGWGCAWLDENDEWQLYHNIQPIWQDTKVDFPETTLFLVHARSAFRDEGIVVENNMPFTDGNNVFLFNGELQGVKIKADGRIGAEKIFNYIKRFDKGDLAEATRRGVDIIDKRTRYIRAMNFFLANQQAVQICSLFGENPGYFQLHTVVQGQTRVVCSQPYSDPAVNAAFKSNEWQTIDNHRTLTLNLADPQTLRSVS